MVVFFFFVGIRKNMGKKQERREKLFGHGFSELNPRSVAITGIYMVIYNHGKTKSTKEIKLILTNGLNFKIQDIVSSYL